MSNISKAYADALFELSIEENILEEIKEQTALLLQVLADNADFVKLLTKTLRPQNHQCRAASHLLHQVILQE